MNRIGRAARLARRIAGVADAAMLGVALGVIWTGVALNAWDDYTNQIAATRLQSANLTRAFAESALRTMREIDQTLRYVRAMYQRDGTALDLQPWVDTTEPGRHLAMQISIMDRNGLLRMTNLHPVTDWVDLSDRQHFRHFDDHPMDELFISVPVVGRVSNKPSIQFVRMLTTAAGNFDGIVVLSVDPDYLVQLYHSVDVGATGRVTLTGFDGVVRAGVHGAAIGTNSASPAIARARHAGGGTFDWTDPADGVRRLTGFERVDGTELVVEVRRNTAEAARLRFKNSIKQIGPALCPDSGYDDLDVVVDGAAASAAFLRLASGDIAALEQAERIRPALLAYCQRDTLAMVEVHCALHRLANPTGG